MHEQDLMEEIEDEAFQFHDMVTRLIFLVRKERTCRRAIEYTTPSQGRVIKLRLVNGGRVVTPLCEKCQAEVPREPARDPDEGPPPN